jgi:hypothetical protein
VGAPLGQIEPARQRTGPGGSAEGRTETGFVELDPSDAVSLDVGADGAPIEAFASLPARLVRSGAGETRLVVTASPNVTVEALAVVPLSDELPPPPPEPWETSH